MMCWTPQTRSQRWPALLLSFAAGAGIASFCPCASADPFYMGADISLATFMQQQNVTFRDNGISKPLDTLLYDRGANLFRLRLFVNPSTNYSATSGASTITRAT